MSLATLPSAPRTAAPRTEAPAAPRLRAVPEGTEVRGFVLYVGVDEAKTAAAGTDLAALVEALRSLTTELVPGAQTHAAVALAPRGAGGRDVDVVRLALQDPSALASRTADAPSPDVVQGVVIDLSRKRVLLDEETAPLTYKEFELLQYLVLREAAPWRGPTSSRRCGRTRTPMRRTSARSTSTCAASGRSSATTRTSCAPFAAPGTASIGTRMSSCGTTCAAPAPTCDRLTAPIGCAEGPYPPSAQPVSAGSSCWRVEAPAREDSVRPVVRRTPRGSARGNSQKTPPISYWRSVT